ncbi:MAG: hypothetical protein R3C29_01735 [Dehalococcoidia bacterium]|nr:hypothetical protein [Dehalococcoidia bacterium]MCA9824649.1 hypothetical protein [Dehalococcoidia bacterium]MCA9845471.1 hypothetical protein [Dehalococcoidia bacterium]
MSSIALTSAVPDVRPVTDIQSAFAVAAASKAIQAQKAVAEGLIGLIDPNVGNNLNVSA